MTPNVSANARIVAGSPETGSWIQKTSDACGGDACIRRANHNFDTGTVFVLGAGFTKSFVP